MCYQVTHNSPIYLCPFLHRTRQRSLTALSIANSGLLRAIQKPPKLEKSFFYILVHLAILWNQALTPAVLPRPTCKKPPQKINNAERTHFSSGTPENHRMQVVFCPNQDRASQIKAYNTFPTRTASLTRSRAVYPCVKASGGNNTKEKRKPVPLDIPKGFFWPTP